MRQIRSSLSIPKRLWATTLSWHFYLEVAYVSNEAWSQDEILVLQDTFLPRRAEAAQAALDRSRSISPINLRAHDFGSMRPRGKHLSC